MKLVIAKLIGRKQLEWYRCASTTTGGKPYFYNAARPGPGRSITVSWDRVDRCWRWSSGPNYETKSRQGFKTAAACRRAAEQELYSSRNGGES